MKIRSITAFFSPGYPIQPETVQTAGNFLQAARQAYTAAGFEVQSVRMATPPFFHLLGDAGLPRATEFAQRLEVLAAQAGIEYISLGPAQPEMIASYAAIPEMLFATHNVFASGSLTTDQSEISFPAVRACAQVIYQAARISPDGFGNLRFTASGNVPPGSPFFPAAYGRPGEMGYAIATEAADLAVEALATAFSLEQARSQLIESVNTAAARLEETAAELARRFQVKFEGIDFTLAPFPDQRRSLGYAIERTGVPAIGLSGSTAMAAFLADSLDRAVFPRAGFSGLMFPVLEDATLAMRAAEGLIGISDLLLYSTVCGTGLDTVPLPGDASPDQIYAVLLDLAALSLRLNKPLTARLMPIPGQVAGDPTQFKFAYFANSRILPLPAEPLRGLLTGTDSLEIKPRRRA